MAIKKIRISNFKSFSDLEVELGNFNILIGANASGKSNFIEIFKFLRDITNYDLDNAISMQGGVKYLRNINIGSSENFSLEFVADQEYKRVAARTEKKGLIGLRTYETIYKFAMKFRKKGLGFGIAEDKLTQKFDLVRLDELKTKFKEKETIGRGKIIISKVNGKVNIDSLKLPKGVPIKKNEIFPPFLIEEKLKPKTLLLELPFFFMPHLFSYISIYDFDPKLPKRATPITGKATLEEDGSNLAIVVNNILENRDRKRKLSNLLRDLLPFIDNLDVDKFADKSLLFKLRETYAKKQYLPASLISDGTINITALIIALYFVEQPLTIIEEPERNIHPYLISKLIDMMKEVSQRKQIFVTTHSPEVVKYADLKDILLISRDAQGFSIISRPADKQEVQTFLKNEIGIEELYLKGLLEI